MIQIENTATRIPVVLCLDTSYSMVLNGGFDALNSGVDVFFTTCKKDSVNKYGFDVAIVTFGADGVTRYQDFRPIWNQEEIPSLCFNPSLIAHDEYGNPIYRENGLPRGTELWTDGTPLGRGVDLAMEGLRHRKEEYQENAIGYYQPWLVIITDGQPTDDGEKYRQTVNAVLGLQRSDANNKKRLKVIAIGVGSEDYRKLSEFVIDRKVLTTKDFSEFDQVFEFLSKSMSDAGTNGMQAEIEESPVAQIMEDLEDEGVSISIEDFGRDED
jgi:uncharacterized protein YegL